jgi:hypothetical protein
MKQPRKIIYQEQNASGGIDTTAIEFEVPMLWFTFVKKLQVSVIRHAEYFPGLSLPKF